MKKVKTFLHIFANSLLPNRAYYQKILKAPFSFSLKYFLALILALNFIFVIFLSVKLNPWKVNQVFNDLINSLEQFPENLSITIKNGYLMTNHYKPYFLWFDHQTSKRLLLVVDETASPKKIQEYNSDILVTSREVIVRNPQNTFEQKMIKLASLNIDSINKATARNAQLSIATIRRFFLFTYPLLLFLAFIVLVITSFLTTLLYLIVACSVVYLVYLFFLRKKGRPKFSQVLHTSFHSITTPIVLNYLLGMFYLGIPLLPLFFLLLITVFTLAGLYEGYTHQHHHPLHK